MSDPELLKLTASEPLSIEQEYEMQETWRNDEDSKEFNLLKFSKILSCLILLFFTECTFLVLNKAVYEQTQDEIGEESR